MEKKPYEYALSKEQVVNCLTATIEDGVTDTEVAEGTAAYRANDLDASEHPLYGEKTGGTEKIIAGLARGSGLNPEPRAFLCRKTGFPVTNKKDLMFNGRREPKKTTRPIPDWILSVF